MTLVHRLHDPNFTIPDWLYNSLGLRNPRKTESLQPFYDFIFHEAKDVPGDIAEFGVFRGDSLLSTGLLLLRLGIRKTVYGFDTFSGFPALHANDDPTKFEWMRLTGAMSERHLEAVQMLREAQALGLYKQHRFDSTSELLVRERVAKLNLPNIELLPGEFRESVGQLPANVRFCAVLMDCDLYDSYHDTLPSAWERLSPGGIIYLDEYFSLKYPGARIAIDEFCRSVGVVPERVLAYAEPGEFERWYLRKPRT